MPKLFKVDVPSEADLRVFVADIRTEAHLVIFETADPWAASQPGLWCYVDVRGEADRTVCLVGSAWEADLVVYRTDVPSDSGWLDSSKAGLL